MRLDFDLKVKNFENKGVFGEGQNTRRVP